MRVLGLTLVSIALLACGGKIDDGTDSGVDSGGADSKSDSQPPPICKANGFKCSASSECCSQLCDPNTGACAGNVPSCKPDGAACTSPQQCCSQFCTLNGTCSTPPPPPPPPPCKPDGVQCSSAGECCSSTCNAGMCGVSVACASTSTKLCDQCVAQNCCSQFITCGSDTTCSNWLGCVQNCEQQGSSAFACTQNTCGLPQNVNEKSLYTCAQQLCATQCTKD